MGEKTHPTRSPGLHRNVASYAGLAIVFASFTSIVLLVLIELTGSGHENPYMGIFTYIIFPGVLGFGIVTVLAGMVWERRRRRRVGPSEISPFPVLDLNDPRRRRSLGAFLAVTFLFVFMSAFGSYRAYEYTESVEFCGTLCHTVMKPEFVAYQASPHARVRCVDCHVGPGADWYVKSKLSGAYQVYAAALDKFPRPITTPVHDLRPATDTCEQCHWPEKFFGAQLMTIDRFGYDEQNTASRTRMLINTGGGDPNAGPVIGSHWHVSSENEVTYVSTDQQRQVIPWVRHIGNDGTVTEYTLAGSVLSRDEIARAPKRRMDCVDCHNRPSHIYVPPDRSVNEAMAAGRLDPTLPYLKRQAVEALSRSYTTNDEAVAAISSSIESFYRLNYPDVFATRRDAVDAAAAEVRRIFETYSFPEMKTDWRTHPDNAGHFYFQGCFRCHDGKHVSDTGKVIRNDCGLCHTVLDQTYKNVGTVPPDGAYVHPVDLGPFASRNCWECHDGARGFEHPVKLGDIRQFRCAECHSSNAEGSRVAPSRRAD